VQLFGRAQCIIVAVWAGLVFGTTGYAGTSEYTCTITQTYQLKEIGELEAPSEENREKVRPRHTFTISRESGMIVGKESELDTRLAKATVVIHKGSKESSFVAVADFGETQSGTRAYRVIRIEEYKKGSDKPFVAMRDLDIVTGTCR
jgi:hypothetical protein